MTEDSGRVPDGTGLSQVEPASSLAPSGFDPSRAQRAWADWDGLDAEMVGSRAPWRVVVALRAAFFAGFEAALSDSDGSPKGGDACGSVHDSAGRSASEGIAR